MIWGASGQSGFPKARMSDGDLKWKGMSGLRSLGRGLRCCWLLCVGRGLALCVRQREVSSSSPFSLPPFFSSQCTERRSPSKDAPALECVRSGRREDRPAAVGPHSIQRLLNEPTTPSIKVPPRFRSWGIFVILDTVVGAAASVWWKNLSHVCVGGQCVGALLCWGPLQKKAKSTKHASHNFRYT